MLGRGCSYKGSCQKYKKECQYGGSSWYTSNYCDNTMGGYEKCPENPGNYSNRQQLRQEVDKKANANARANIIVIIIIAVIVYFIFFR